MKTPAKQQSCIEQESQYDLTTPLAEIYKSEVADSREFVDGLIRESYQRDAGTQSITTMRKRQLTAA